MKHIKDVTDVKNKKILLRADFNVPIKNSKIVDTYRVDKTLKTINHLVKKGAIVTIVSHLGDDGSESLLPVYEYLEKKGLDISFFIGPITEKTVAIIHSERTTKVVLIENIRVNRGEKKNDPKFAKTLSTLGDLYVNDAFSVSHREHASIVGVTKYLKGYAGFQLADEVTHLSKMFKPKHPFIFILGGNKFSTKLPLLKKFTKQADTLFLGGALLNDVLLCVGFPVGVSLVEKNKKNIDELKKVYINKKFIAPDDVVVERNGKSINISVNDVQKNDAIYDVGVETLNTLLEKISSAKAVLWNGPLGKYTAGYDKASKKLLKVLADSKKEVILGGGDTVALVNKMKLGDAFTFVSTGGGATLDFLAKGTLPGIKVLSK
jgi:phosphoglycerate kinase